MTHGTCLSTILVMVTLIPCGPAQPQAVLPDSALPDPTADSTGLSPLEAGKALYEQGLFEEALVHFERAVDQNGRSAPAHYWLGMAWYALGNNDEALKAFRRTVQLDKNGAPGHVGMGMVYTRLPNRRLDARKAYRRAAESDPGNADIQYRLGMTYMDQERTGHLIGSDRDGRKYFLKAVDLSPAHPDAFFQLGRCYDSPDESEPEKAISAYNPAIPRQSGSQRGVAAVRQRESPDRTLRPWRR